MGRGKGEERKAGLGESPEAVLEHEHTEQEGEPVHEPSCQISQWTGR